MHPDFYPLPIAEKRRYELHNNDVEDPGYRSFVKPIVDYVSQNHSATERGLDFGAGPGPVIAELLAKRGYQLSLYDPFFHDNQELLENKYDYVIACEVVEHFHNPQKEFDRLAKLLSEKGSLVIMTGLFSENCDFESWYYKNDETHVFFYSHDTFKYIKSAYGFKNLMIENRMIILK